MRSSDDRRDKPKCGERMALAEMTLRHTSNIWESAGRSVWLRKGTIYKSVTLVCFYNENQFWYTPRSVVFTDFVNDSWIFYPLCNVHCSKYVIIPKKISYPYFSSSSFSRLGTQPFLCSTPSKTVPQLFWSSNNPSSLWSVQHCLFRW